MNLKKIFSFISYLILGGFLFFILSLFAWSWLVPPFIIFYIITLFIAIKENNKRMGYLATGTIVLLYVIAIGSSVLLTCDMSSSWGGERQTCSCLGVKQWGLYQLVISDGGWSTSCIGIPYNKVISNNYLFSSAEKEIQQRMGSSDLIYVSGGLNWVADPGKTLTRLVAIRNFNTIVNPEGNSFTVEFQPTDDKGNSSWFKISQPGKIKVGEKKTAPIEVRLPKGLPPGTSYSFSIVVKRDNAEYETQSIIVSVKEKE